MSMHYDNDDVVATFADMPALEAYLEEKRQWYSVEHYSNRHEIIMSGSNRYYYYHRKHYEEV